MTGARGIRSRLTLFLAQGFMVGRIPVAPGTFGSVLGVGWFLLLLRVGGGWPLVMGSALAAALAVPLCGAAEKILGKRDPGSVVLDEIVAIPICFWAWLALHHSWGMPRGIEGLSLKDWIVIGCGFGCFRLFDIWKPWPVRQSQALPGGYGVVVDDVLAAGLVNLLTLALWGVGLFR